MAIDQKAVLDQIYFVIRKLEETRSKSGFNNYHNLSGSKISELNTLIAALIERLTLPNSQYRKNVDETIKKFTIGNHYTLSVLDGIMNALKTDYEAGYFQKVHELIHADIFSDFLEMARYLLNEGYKDPAAVIAGGVLEEHLRKLCEKNDIDVIQNDRYKKVETLNAELKKAGVYETLDQKNVSAWYDLRTKAAHGNYYEYTKDQVALMIQGIQDFITRHPA